MIKKIAKKWRGLRAYRYLKGPLSLREYVFAKEWEKLNTRGSGYSTYADHLCIDGDNEAFSPQCPDQERIIMNTVIQWLGTNCGQAFLHSVDTSIKDIKSKRIEERKKICPNKMRCLTQKGEICLCEFSE